MLEIFMLLFNFAVITPEGDQREEIINVYSRIFDDKDECEEFLNDWEDTIRGRGVEALQDMLKEGFIVKLKYVGCAKPTNLIDGDTVDVDEFPESPESPE